MTYIGKTKQQAKEECLSFEWTLWQIFGQTELHFFSPRNMEQIQSYYLFQMQVISCTKPCIFLIYSATIELQEVC